MSTNTEETIHHYQPLVYHQVSDDAETLQCIHGKISFYRTKEILEGKEDGSFLVRESGTLQGAYALCLQYREMTRQYRIRPVSSGNIALQSEAHVLVREYPTLSDLIHDYISRGDQNGLACALKHPVSVGEGGDRTQHDTNGGESGLSDIKPGSGITPRELDCPTDGPCDCSCCMKATITSYCFPCGRGMCDACQHAHQIHEQYSGHIAAKIPNSSVPYMVCTDHNMLYSCICYSCVSVACQICHQCQHSGHETIDFTTCGPAKFQISDAEMSDIISSLSVATLATDMTAVLTKIISFDTGHSLAELASILSVLQSASEQRKSRYNLLQPFPQLRNRPVNEALELLKVFKDNLFVTHIQEMDPTRYFFIPRRDLDFEGSSLGCKSTEQDPLSLGVIIIIKEILRTELRSFRTFYEFSAEKRMEHENTMRDNVAGEDKAELVWRKKTHSSVICMATEDTGDLVLVEGGFISRRVKTYMLKDGSECSNHSYMEDDEVIDSISIERSTGDIAIGSTISDYVVIYRKRLDSVTQEQHKVGYNVTGLAYTKNGHLIVGGHSPLYCIDSKSGNALWKLSTGQKCHYIAIDSTEHLIISDNVYTNQVHVYNTEGRLLSIPDADDDAKLQDPRGVCVDSRDNILVVDRKKEVILMFGPNGNFIKEVVKVPGKPKFITLYQDKFLYVATSKKTISLYKVSL